MLKSAETILNEHHFTRQEPECDIDELIRAINEARIEAIRECAEEATVDLDVDYTECCVNKQSILDLINQVK